MPVRAYPHPQPTAPPPLPPDGDTSGDARAPWGKGPRVYRLGAETTGGKQFPKLTKTNIASGPS